MIKLQNELFDLISTKDELAKLPTRKVQQVFSCKLKVNRGAP
jgi:hypothetical protein